MNPRTALSLLAVSTVLLAGCSGSSDKPKTLPSLTAAPTATASPAAVPAAAKAKTPQGADAFVRFFFRQLNAAFNSSDSSLIRDLSDPRCGTCANYVRALDADRSQVIQGPSFAVNNVAAAPPDNNSVLVEVFGVIPARKLVDLQGHVLQDLKSDGPFHYTLSALSTSTGWTVRAIRVNPS